MPLFDYFRAEQKPTSAKIAKERLQIIVAHERSRRDGPDYLPRLREEILNVIRKYVRVDDQAVKVNLEREDDYEVLELNIILPDEQTGTGD